MNRIKGFDETGVLITRSVGGFSTVPAMSIVDLGKAHYLNLAYGSPHCGSNVTLPELGFKAGLCATVHFAHLDKTLAFPFDIGVGEMGQPGGGQVQAKQANPEAEKALAAITSCLLVDRVAWEDHTRPLRLHAPSLAPREQVALMEDAKSRLAVEMLCSFLNHSVEAPRPERWQKWLDKLDLFRERGMDHCDYPRPTIAAVRNAKVLVIEADNRNIIPEHVEPSAMGGVGVTFAAGVREVVVEFYNNGTAHALFADDGTDDMRTTAVATDHVGYRKLLGEVRKYLYGK